VEAPENSTSARTPARDRHVLAAIVLGVLVPGLGQAYAGYTIRAFIWFVGAVGLGTLTVHALLTNQRPPLNLALPMMALLAYYLVEVFDAARLTRRQASTPATHPWWIWITVVALFLFIVQPAVTSVFRRSGQGFTFESDSMAPTLLNHDYVMANKTVNERRHGEVIVFAPPPGSTRPRSIARVIGLPGDRVAVHDGRAIVNDAPLVEPYISVPRARGYRFGPVSVPPGTLFVLGDNRGQARDSRSWGFLPMNEVVGRVNLVYFSQDPLTGAVRWDRIGQPVR
jgi:signal peptidase I